jgi:hypothetical protein
MTFLANRAFTESPSFQTHQDLIAMKREKLALEQSVEVGLISPLLIVVCL